MMTSTEQALYFSRTTVRLPSNELLIGSIYFFFLFDLPPDSRQRSPVDAEAPTSGGGMEFLHSRATQPRSSR
jgi:hypothetical protein